VVFAGHDHFYERVKPQKGGILHFVVGAGGSLRRGDIRRTDLTDKGFDADYSFLIAEIDGDSMHFQAISRKGQTVDSGVFRRPDAAEGAAAVVAPAPSPAANAPAPEPRPEPKPEAAAAGPSPCPCPCPSPAAASPSPSPVAGTKAKPKARKKPPAGKT
jgi:hypothetical protein